MLRPSRFNVFSLVPKTLEKGKVAGEKFNAKIKGTFIEKMVVYVRTLLNDYKDVAVSVRQDIREKPAKATLIFTGMGFVGFCLTHNPNEQSFKAKFMQCSNEVSLVSSNVVNPEIVDHLTYIRKCYNIGLIRHTSFGLFSIVWVDKYSDTCDKYEANCSYLQVPYSQLPSRILDVGFWNYWWVTSRKMLDYDINY